MTIKDICQMTINEREVTLYLLKVAHVLVQMKDLVMDILCLQM